MFEDKTDYENATDLLSTFISLKTGAELVETTNMGQIRNHCTEQNGVYFSKSRFSNIYQLSTDHIVKQH